MKFYNLGRKNAEDLHVPTEKKKGHDGVVREYVKVPPLHASQDNQLVEHKPGNIYVPLHGHGFYVVPVGSFFEPPAGVSAAAVKSIAPHLLTEEEYLLQKQGEAPAPMAATAVEGQPEALPPLDMPEEPEHKPAKSKKIF